MNQLVPIATHAPALIRAAGERAQTCFLEFIRLQHSQPAHSPECGGQTPVAF
jgi:hypothetical protein